ncbi:MAG TPA: hypothetical protein PLE30_04085 [Candidatus Kapabacteria bacterium]|nr:hypothetical protein [Candidatus Kapabacteria bacterium]
MVKKFIPLVLALGFIMTGMSLAQDLSNPLLPTYQRPPIYIGPVFGYNRSMHSVDLASFDEAICPRFQNGDANGFYAGLSWEQMLGDLASSNSSFIVRVLYNTMPANLETSENPIPSLVTVVDANGNPSSEVILNSSTTHTQEIKYSMITGEVMYKLNPFGAGLPLGFTIGPTFDFAMSKTQSQKYKLVTPLEAQFKRNDAAGYRYEDNDRTIVIKDGDIPESSSFRFGLKAGVQYEIITSGKMYIVPAMYYNFGVTNLSSRENWRVNALQVGVDIRFAL